MAIKSLLIVLIQTLLLIGTNGMPLPQTDGNGSQNGALTGKMLSGGQMNYGYPGFPQQAPMGGMYPGMSGMSGMNGMSGMYGGGLQGMGAGYMPGMMNPYMPTMGGSGYIPNYLQQYDMLYSRNRKTTM